MPSDHISDQPLQAERITVPAEGGSARLDAFLAARPGAPTRSQLRAAIDRQEVLVNGRPTKAGYSLREGDIITLPPPNQPASNALPEAIPLEILDEDAHLLIVNKPSGMVVHPAAGHTNGTLVNALLHHYAAEMSAFPTPDLGKDPRPGIVHRIDRETSGLLVVAKTVEAHAFLSAQFAAHTTERTYWALCAAPGFPERLRIESLLSRHSNDRKRYASHPTQGKRAVTHAQVLERFVEGGALIACRLETGRTHQIRVHLSENRAPLLGDDVYGGRAASTSPLISRVALHALTLGFIHPDGTPRLYHSTPPADFMSALTALRAGRYWRSR